MWDHLAHTPEMAPLIGTSCILRGKAGKPNGPGWSRTIHYEVSSMGRVNYQVNNSYQTADGGDSHAVVAILTINLSSH